MTPRRAEARAAVLADIRNAARAQLAEVGPAALSLRAIARELGMVSSGIYRYVASRDELLTMLVVAGYADLADAVEAAVATRGDAPSRWLRGCRAVRSFALARPHEYALLYGTPVPGYAAPQDTIAPATRVYAALAAPLSGTGGVAAPAPCPRVLASDAAAIVSGLPLDADHATALRFIGALAQLFGLISFELFGHTHGVISDGDAFFDWSVKALGRELGLAG
ncbi:MAG TPA: TetR/AcrR family transcriptional regulator [Acidimicrobiales bacterium]|nr:TetR/AcrR family transcriptional regulator [Acidimicrobiales bacterium]